MIGTIISCLAFCISLISFLISRGKAGKSSLDDARNKIIELQNALAQVQRQLSCALASSDEILALKTQLGIILKEQEANHQILTSNSTAIKRLQDAHFAVRSADQNALKRSDEEVNAINPSHASSSINELPPSLDTPLYSGLNLQPNPCDETQPDVGQKSQASQAFNIACQQYQDALESGSKQALRQLQFKELNITSECENQLAKGTSGEGTRLETVVSGGSYLVICGQGRYWLFPTSQTLDSFSMNQPKKGIFTYEPEVSISRPTVRRPAEVREESEYWTVIEQGVISVPS